MSEKKESPSSARESVPKQTGKEINEKADTIVLLQKELLSIWQRPILTQSANKLKKVLN